MNTRMRSSTSVRLLLLVLLLVLVVVVVVMVLLLVVLLVGGAGGGDGGGDCGAGADGGGGGAAALNAVSARVREEDNCVSPNQVPRIAEIVRIDQRLAAWGGGLRSPESDWPTHGALHPPSLPSESVSE